MQNRRTFYGWWIVLATSVIHFIGAGFFFYSFTAFFNPLVREFKWSYAATSFASSFRSLESGIASPLVGFLTDRYGPRRLIFLGAIWSGVGCMLLSRIDSLMSFYAAFIFLSMGSSMMFPIPGWTAVTHWFLQKRGLALGILVAAIGFSGILIPVVTWLITGYGWRTTFVIAGAAMMIIGIPLSMVIRHRPEEYGYVPDGNDRPTEPVLNDSGCHSPVKIGKEESVGAREAMKHPTFWGLTLVATISGTVLHAVVVHVMPALIDIGIRRGIAGTIAASLVISSVAGRMGFGWLGDRYEKRYLLVICLLLQILGLIIFAYTRNATHAVAFLMLYGPGFGGVITLRLTMQGDYFGRKSFGAIQGIMQGIHMVGSIASPVFAGWIFDMFASYQLVWFVLAILTFMAIPSVLMLKSP